MLKVAARLSVIVLVIAMSTAAYAARGGGGGGGGGFHGGGGGGGFHGGGGGFRGGGGFHGGGGFGGGGFRSGGGLRGGGARFVRPSSRGNIVRSSPGVSGDRIAVTRNGASASLKVVKSNAVRDTLSSRSVAGALHNTSALRDSHTRADITARAATAGWHEGRDGEHGWWRHRNGGYGWVGPLYWPFAYYDIYDYAMWGDDYDDSFWGYGYGDIYAGLFAPYDYDDLTGYLPQQAGIKPSGAGTVSTAAATPGTATDQVAQMCGQDSRDIAGLPIDQFWQAIQPTEAQTAALDDLASASVKAAQGIKAACPSDVALTAPSRLANMQQRIEAMIAAVAIVQPPLEKFYDLLSDEQKLRLTALAKDRRQANSAKKPASSPVRSCGAAQPGVMEWPTAEIDRTVIPTDAQRASLAALQDASAKAADMLKASCLTDNPITPPARLAAVGKRLDTILEAVKTVRSALNDFYGTLTDEQKAKFEAIGPQQTSRLESLEVSHTSVRRRGAPDIGQVIRRLISVGL